MRYNYSTNRQDTQGLRVVCPLAVFWPYGPDRFRNTRIELLPPRFRATALKCTWLQDSVRGALLAVEYSETMARDQWDGR